MDYDSVLTDDYLHRGAKIARRGPVRVEERTMVAQVEVLYATNARDIVAQLRQCADNIEKGDEVYRGAVFCLAGPGGTVDVYAWGDLDNYSAPGVLECAKVRIHTVVSGA